MELKHILLAKSIGAYINTLSYTNPEKATALAYQFFSNPRVGKLFPTQLPKVLQDAKRETFKYDAYECNTYIWEGNEQVILLVHGWESNASRWEKLLPHLKKSGSTIVAIDAPAHGLSSGSEFSMPVYAEFLHLAAQKFKPQVLIGHSIGGATCIYYQYKYQNDGLKKMVVLGAPSDLKILTQNYINLLGLNAKTVTLLEDFFIQRFRFKVEEFSGKIFSAKITTNGFIAHDIDDDVVSFEEGKKIATSWTSATFIETKGLGHSMHNDELYQKVCAFLFGTE